MTKILHLSPSDIGGPTICPMAKLANCEQACLNTAGRGGFGIVNNNTLQAENNHILPNNIVQNARLNRTRLFHNNRRQFMAFLINEIKNAEKMASRNNLKLAIRLNGTSDIRWENMIADYENNLTIFEVFPHVQFYDYTKIAKRLQQKLPHNYHLTVSYSRANNKYALYVNKHVGENHNLAVVFRKTAPNTFMGRKVINGDEHDLRFLDPPGSIVALTAKGQAKKDQSGFVIDA